MRRMILTKYLFIKLKAINERNKKITLIIITELRQNGMLLRGDQRKPPIINFNILDLPEFKIVCHEPFRQGNLYNPTYSLHSLFHHDNTLKVANASFT